MALHQNLRSRVFGVVAVAFLLVAEADFQRVLVPGGADQAGLDPLVLDQRIQRHRRAVYAQIGLRQHFVDGSTKCFCNLCKTLSNGTRAVLRRGSRLEQQHLSLLVSQHKIGERAAGVYAQSIAHGESLFVG